MFLEEARDARVVRRADAEGSSRALALKPSFVLRRLEDLDVSEGDGRRAAALGVRASA